MMNRKMYAIAVGLLVGLCGAVQAQQEWMSPDVGSAWRQGFQGQGVRVNVIDNFSYSPSIGMNHGAATLWQSQAVAPAASVVAHQWFGGVVGLTPGLNVFNLSYGVFALGEPQTSAVISYAQRGQAVVVKAAGNSSIPVGAADAQGRVDVLGVALAGQPSAILVGALARNGSPENRAPLASYSNTAGTSPVVQRNFLVVGVDTGRLGLSGTSFAAPIVSGYAAILGSKFNAANASAISNQLLNTARTDTISGYNPAVHGRGEASLSRALAPASIR